MATSIDIITDRLVVTPFSEKYLTNKYVHWLNSKKVMRFSEQRHLTHDMESCKQYYKSFKGTPSFFWAICEKEYDLRHIGNASALVDAVNKTAELTILIGEAETWGKGYATEVLKSIISYLFTEEGLRKINIGTISSNTPMLKVLKKIGLEPDGVKKRHYLWEQKEVDEVMMCVLKDDWSKAN